MTKYIDFTRKYQLNPQKYTLVKNATILKTDKETVVMKQKKRPDKEEIYQYLLSRNFDYFPRPINNLQEDDYEVYPFLEGIITPKEQRAVDLIYLVSLLHNKTTFYKEIDLDDIKNFYEETSSKLIYLENYYSELQNIIENNIYMSPSEYLLVRNISKIYQLIYFCKQMLERWYEIISSKKKERYVMLHNNLELDHFIKNDGAYLISWDKAKRGIAVYDIYKLFKKHYLDFDFLSILELYERKYPLLEEEKILLFLLLATPEKIVLEDDEYNKCVEISKYLTYLDKLNILLSEENTPKSTNEAR